DNRKEMNRTASTNLITLRGMSDKQKEERRFNDLMTISGIKNTGAVKSEINNITPEKYELSQNYPNPFNPVTNIQFTIPKSGLVSLKVYDVLGREVKSLVNEFKQAGSYIVSFDVRHGGSSSELSSGIYFYRLEAGDFVQIKRMILLK
ncbi:MAG: T9SS type A sorting domain-containing protein, partial [Ignavibacteria bacterium]|nr:T9SS type A sorting domain-containing protein [Ignavibacteria bacterium]